MANGKRPESPTNTVRRPRQEPSAPSCPVSAQGHADTDLLMCAGERIGRDDVQSTRPARRAKIRKSPARLDTARSWLKEDPLRCMVRPMRWSDWINVGECAEVSSVERASLRCVRHQHHAANKVRAQFESLHHSFL